MAGIGEAPLLGGITLLRRQGPLATRPWTKPLSVAKKPAAEDLTTVGDLFGRPSWLRWAACRDEGSDSFIVGIGGNYGRAKELRASCTVRTECLEVALTHAELVGVWGGTTEKDRVRMRANRGVA
jgi:WhiB family redox-sensing transcriptional regulator